MWLSRMSDIEYSILGPLSVRLAPEGAPVALGEKLRLLLGRLLLEPGVTLTVDTLADAVWGGEEWLASPTNSLHVAIRQLRGRLADPAATRHVLARVGPGYRLMVPDPLRIDAQRFKRLAERGRALIEPHPWAARAMLAEA